MILNLVIFSVAIFVATEVSKDSALAEWSKALLVRVKINESQKGPRLAPGQGISKRYLWPLLLKMISGYLVNLDHFA